METRAAVAHKAGQPLAIETVRLDGPKAGEVLVEIKATGICHTDQFTLSGADRDVVVGVVGPFELREDRRRGATGQSGHGARRAQSRRARSARARSPSFDRPPTV